MERAESATAFPVLDIDAAGEQDAGKIEIPLDLMEQTFIQGDDLNRKSIGAVETALPPSRNRDPLSAIPGLD